jgi:hypothetical protein
MTRRGRCSPKSSGRNGGASPRIWPTPIPDQDGDERDWGAPIAHQPEHQRRNRDPEPYLCLDQPDAERGKRQPKTELQSSRDAARQSACEPANHTGQTKDQKKRPDDETRPGNRRRLHRLDQYRCRCCLHRLDGHRNAIEGTGECIEEPEGRQDAGRVHLHDRDRADDVR